MITRVLLAALLVGIVAGALIGVLQHMRLTPLILQAETVESGHSEHANAGDTTGHPHDHGEAFVPQDGFERTAYTLLTTAVAGAGFAAILVGISFVTAIPITAGNGFVWGICGFLAFSLAPSVGLPPELPGMPAAEFNQRTLWWIMTVVCTAIGLWMMLAKRVPWAVVVGLGIALLPHVIGAPQPASQETAVSGGLAQQFVANALGLRAVFWIITGIMLGYALDQIKDKFAS
jgi:cobalt transporter subunit CbtA